VTTRWKRLLDLGSGFFATENLCGLVGVFITGPLGLIVGGLAGWLTTPGNNSFTNTDRTYFRERSESRMNWSSDERFSNAFDKPLALWSCLL
jgi:hypothetical protein